MKFSYFGIISEVIREYGYDGAAAHIRELGFSGIEPIHGHALQTTADARKLKAAMEKEGLVATSFSAYVNIAGATGAEDEERLMLYADMAAELGSPFLHHTLTPRYGYVTPEDEEFKGVFDEVAERAGRVADYAAKAGITCLYEDQGCIFNGLETIGMLLSALNRENTGVCADIGNIMKVDGNPQDFIRRYAGLIRNVHIKDNLWKPAHAPDPGEGWDRTISGAYIRATVPGHGAVPISECLSILAALGYSGWYAFEFFGPEDVDWGMRAAIANITRYINEIAK